MDIHKPKPVHNLREFASEIVIIVIGVLIALGLEQAVEAWHWAHEVEQERASLIAEEQKAQQSFVLRAIQHHCIDRRLSELNTILERHRLGVPLGIIAPLGRPARAGVSVGAWQIALAGQGLAHMPLTEKLKFDEKFSSFSYWNDIAEEEQAIWRRLSLVDQYKLLSEQDWSNIRLAYAEAVTINNRVGSNYEYFIAPAYRNATSIDQLKVTADARSRFATAQRELCASMIRP